MVGAVEVQPKSSISGRRIWVAGHNGLVGSALMRRLARDGATTFTIGRDQLDLRRQADVEAWLRESKPELVIVAAAMVGGIQANRTRPAEFLHDNLMIAANIIKAAHAVDVGKLVFLSSSCVYPRLASQPIAETAMLTGPLEPTNEWYAIAKITGQKLCDAYRRQYGRDFISVVPAAVYGPEDNFDLQFGHVLPSLLRRFHEAKAADQPQVTLWGTGSPGREFLFVDDVADAIVFLATTYSEEGPINIPAPAETSIAQLASEIASVVGYDGKITYDTTRPDGMPRKVVDGRRLTERGWRPSTPLRDGLRLTYRWLTDQLAMNAPVRGYGPEGVSSG